MKKPSLLNQICWIHAVFYNKAESAKITPTVRLKQVHSAEAAVLTDLPKEEIVADALVSRLADVPLMVRTADCAPVLLADTKTPVIAAVHAGWKGTFQGILETTVLKMQQLGAGPETLVAAVGPHLQAKSFEAGDDMRALFPVPEQGLFQPLRDKPGKYRFDFAAYVRLRLMRAGVHMIETAGEDTKTDLQYASYRRNPSDTARQFSSIMIQREKIR